MNEAIHYLKYAAALAIGIAAIPGTVLAGAGHSDGNGHHGANIGMPGQEADVSRTITVVMKDVAYDPSLIAVAPGETVKFVIRNEGQLVHEFNIGTPEMHAQHQKEMQAMTESGMLTAFEIKEEMAAEEGEPAPMKHDDPNSVLLESGESAELIWRFSDARKVEFACNIPGHYESGMVGQFTLDVSMK